jgi:hypothetical protein
MLTTHHEVAHVSRPKNRQRRGDIDAKRLGGLQVDARPGAIRLDVSVGSKADLKPGTFDVSSPLNSGHLSRRQLGPLGANSCNSNQAADVHCCFAPVAPDVFQAFGDGVF